MSDQDLSGFDGCNDIAVIGMAGRFPCAPDLETFWRNLVNGVEAISFFSDDEMEAGDLTPEELNDPNFVKARAILDDVEMFDAPFFNIPAREAEWMDPQQRMFLEYAWSAIEDAGYNPGAYEGLIAVYAGVSANTYLLSRATRVGSATDLFNIILANDKDHLSTRVSYKLNLRGESITVQSACSTSLVAVHLACQSLLSGQSDMAIAGGVTIRFPQKIGYLYQKGMVSSPDGHCRAFDHKAQGTVSGNGVGIVVLKRLNEALDDNDSIRAVIKGSAVNNDGNLKVGYMAPSIEGQADVISKALSMAGVSPDTIGYVEAHGTGTPIGDPIEVEALTKAYRQWTSRKQFCVLGSVKTNVGHLDGTAGVAGLIKTILALEHKQLPPTLHFEKSNPSIDFENSPFFVGSNLIPWKRGETPLRAGVSSFGIGGTNAHVILEEAPPQLPFDDPRSLQIIPISAKSPVSLRLMAEELARRLAADPDLNLADVSYTLTIGRQEFPYRRFVVAEICAEAAEAFRASARIQPPAAQSKQSARVVFMFPGQGTQSPNLAKEIYYCEGVFRRHVDLCAEILKPQLNADLRKLLYPERGIADESTELLHHPEFTLPTLFTIEYALAQLWMSYGISPQAMIGHSYGEYVAACLAGVFTVEDALTLSVARGRLMQRLAAGAMVAIRLSEEDAKKFLTDSLSIAAVNSSDACVMSGSVEAVEGLKLRLAEQRIACREMPAKFAFHSALVEPILAEFVAIVDRMNRKSPAIPYVSSVSGQWITPEEATDSAYWANQMRSTVRFSDGLDKLSQEGFNLFLEAGPEQTLCAFVRQRLGRGVTALPSLSRSNGAISDRRALLDSLGRLWTAGAVINWTALYNDQRRRRLPLPTYRFDRQRYWIETALPARTERRVESASGVAAPGGHSDNVEQRPERGDYKHAVDRSRLLNAYEAPRTEIEQRVAAVWGEVLGLDGIGVRDNLYDLGGDSLLATQIFSRIQQSISSDVTLANVLSQQTVAELAAVIAMKSAGERKNEERARPPIVRAPRDGELPLSFSQLRLWFLDRATPGTPLYNLSIAVRATARLDLVALQRSVNEIVRRHEALRTTFSTVKGQPVQVIAERMELPIYMVDLTEAPESAREAAAQQAVMREVALPFDLVSGTLLRFSLIRLKADVHVILLTIHHIVSDAWSLSIFIRELGVLYEAFRNGRPSPLPEMQIQYTDFAYWQREWLRDDILVGQIEYWKKQLSGSLPVLALPTDRPRPPVRTPRGGAKVFLLAPATARELKELSRREGVTLFMTLLAGVKAWLYRYSAAQEIIIGSPIAGRTHPELEPLIGFFLNMLVLRTDLTGNPRFRELLHRVEQVTLGAYANQDVPFEKLVEALQPERSGAYSPLFQVLFNFQNTPPPAIEVSGLALSPVQVDSEIARFDLLLNANEAPDGIVWSVQYSTDLFDGSTIDRMIAQFEVLLRNIAAQPDCRVDELDMLTEDEKQKLAEQASRIEEASGARLKAARRKSIGSSQERFVRIGQLDESQELPLLIQQVAGEVSLNGWLAKNRDEVERLLLTHGAILFRGFNSMSASNLKQLAMLVSPDVLDYTYRSTPRTKVDDKVYTSTEYPAHQPIPLHNENSYTTSWPMKIWFYCALPSQQGGETPIGDSRKIFQMLDPKIKQRFMDKGVMYVRNYGEGLDLSWQEVFQTNDKAEVERYCRSAGMEFQWKSGDRLRTSQRCHSVGVHPKTGETVWFNQAHLFHMSVLGEDMFEALLDAFGEEGLPRHAYYGDGSPIEFSALDEIRAVHDRAVQTFAWKEGDLLMVDNMLVAHGRNPYTGPRKILVVMAEPFGTSDDHSQLF